MIILGIDPGYGTIGYGVVRFDNMKFTAIQYGAAKTAPGTPMHLRLCAKEFDDMPSYTLCVSSAGLARRLKRPEHFEAFMGQTVEVGLYKALNGAKQIEGTLAGYDDGAVTLDVGGERIVFEPKDIAAVRLAVEI